MDTPDGRPCAETFNVTFAMLTDAELQEYCRRLNLTTAAIQYIRRVRASGPSRRVRCGPNNVTAQYPSRKMNHLAPAESHTVEPAFIC